MGEDNFNVMELYNHHGVLVKDIVPYKEDVDFHHNLGTLSIVEYNSELGKCIEWHQCNVSIESDDQEWAIVQGDKKQTQNSNDITRNIKKPEILIQLKNLIHLKISKNNQKLTIEEVGMEITFYFQHGNAETFLNFLKATLRSSIKQESPNCYVVANRKEVEVFEKSFTELDIFSDDSTRSTVLWNFMKSFHRSPYEATMNTFSKVTNALLSVPQYQSNEEVAELLNRSLISDEVNDINGRLSSEDYELIIKSPPLPPRTLPLRCQPLNAEQWSNFFDESGRIVDADLVKEIIFHGGITSKDGTRKEAWKYLLDYYPWNSTKEEREILRKQKAEEYFNMKSQWKSMTPGQVERFAAYKERKNLIEKDVHRTDRNMEFFAGDNNTNLTILQEILMTYVMYNFDLGYVQGMSDLLSPLLVQLNDEVDTFWCFVGFMNSVSRNFEIDQEGMKEQLQDLYCLLCSVEPELAVYLDHHDSKSMSFCFRWLLVWFKREFSYEDIFLLWEVLWTKFLCKNYHLLICTAILDNEKETLMSNNYGFTEILKHINELANVMNLEQILRKAEGIYIQISNASNIPAAVRQIIGLAPLPEKDSARNETKNNLTNEGNDNILNNETSAINSKNYFEHEQEEEFEQSLNMIYL